MGNIFAVKLKLVADTSMTGCSTGQGHFTTRHKERGSGAGGQSWGLGQNWGWIKTSDMSI